VLEAVAGDARTGYLRQAGYRGGGRGGKGGRKGGEGFAARKGAKGAGKWSRQVSNLSPGPPR
jgi:hypothetical protein